MLACMTLNVQLQDQIRRFSMLLGEHWVPLDPQSALRLYWTRSIPVMQIQLSLTFHLTPNRKQFPVNVNDFKVFSFSEGFIADFCKGLVRWTRIESIGYPRCWSRIGFCAFRKTDVNEVSRNIVSDIYSAFPVFDGRKRGWKARIHPSRTCLWSPVHMQSWSNIFCKITNWVERSYKIRW